MAIAFVKNGGTTTSKAVGGATSISVTVPAGGHALNNTVILEWGTDAIVGTGTAPTVTDTRGNTWTELSGGTTGPIHGALAAKLSTALIAGDTITLTWVNGSQAAIAVRTVEFSGVSTIEDVADAGSGLTTTTTPTASITPTAAAVLILAFVRINGPVGDAYTEDADSTGGDTWHTITAVGTTGGGAATNVSVKGPYKITTSAVAQTWTATIASRATQTRIYALRPATDWTATPADSTSISDSVTTTPGKALSRGVGTLVATGSPTYNGDGTTTLDATGTDVVRADASDIAMPFWVFIRFKPTWASTANVNHRFFTWGASTNEEYYLEWSTGAQLGTGKDVAGAGTEQFLTPGAFSANTDHSAYGLFTAAVVGGSWDGAAVTTTAQTNSPVSPPALFDIGCRAYNSGSQLDAVVYWFIVGTGTLTDAQVAALHASGNTGPAWGDVPNMVFYWTADNSFYFNNDGDFTAISDSASAVLGTGNVAVDDFTSLSDAQSFVFGEGLADNATVSDAVAMGPGLGIADATALADALTSFGYGPGINDTTALTDALTSFGRGQGINDTTALADALTVFDFGKGIADSSTPTDAQALGVGESVADSATAGDSATTQSGKEVQPADSATASDSATTQSGKEVQPADSITTSDAQSFDYGEGIADSTSITDARSFEFGPGFADSVTAIDSITTARGFAQAVADATAISDALALGYGIGVTDATALADAIALGYGISKSDTSALADAISFNVGKAVADATAIADAQSFGYGPGIAETIVVADVILTERALALAIIDSITATDLVDAGLNSGTAYTHMVPPLRGTVVPRDLGGIVSLVVCDGVVAVVDSSGVIAAFVAAGTPLSSLTAGTVIDGPESGTVAGYEADGDNV